MVYLANILTMDNKIVVFYPSGARIYINPPELTALLRLPFAVLNPDLSQVSKLPPHYWKLDADKRVVPMTFFERRSRDEANGVTPGPIERQIILAKHAAAYKLRKQWSIKLALACFSLGFLTGLAIDYLRPLFGP